MTEPVIRTDADPVVLATPDLADVPVDDDLEPDDAAASNPPGE